MNAATVPVELVAPAAPSETLLSTWWRWPLVPVGALGGALLVGLLLTMFERISLGFIFGTDNIYFHYLVPFEAAAVGGAAWGHLGCAIAPKAKRIAGTALVTLLGVFTGIGIFHAWSLADVAHPLADTLQYLATFVAAVVAVVAFDE